MGKHKYRSSLLVVEDEASIRNELLRVLQTYFKRKVLVRTAPTLSWALNMDTVPNFLVVDICAATSVFSIRKFAMDIAQYLRKFHEVRVGIFGFWADDVIRELRELVPKLDRVEALSGGKNVASMIEAFVLRQHQESRSL